MPPASRDDECPHLDGYAATLPGRPVSATTARCLVRWLVPRGSPEQELAVAELLTTELVANAVVHARTPCDLRLTFPRDGVLRIEVSDRADGAPAVRATDCTDTDGRGLQLVAALSTQWGTTKNAPSGKTV